MPSRTGHVFVTLGDLTRFAADALILPTDRAFTVEEGWRSLLDAGACPPAGLAQGRVRAFVHRPTGHEDQRVRVWTNVGAESPVGSEWFVDGACEALELAADALGGQTMPGAAGRRPLVALPLVGTGLGGGRHRSGDIVKALLPRLGATATAKGVDVALVLMRERTYAAVQAARASMTGTTFDTLLTPVLRAEGDTLAGYARRGDLVLFIGAGASIGGGLPGWGDLLDRLAGDAGFSLDERAKLRNLDELDRARIVQMRLEARSQRRLGEHIASMMSASPFRPLTQTLLASLPVTQAATTNYDQLFEGASGDVGIDCAILPYAPAPARRRWLLKLHGCVTHPEHIVLTRDDYLRFSSSRAALAGIVQALMVTRHMLFVGFSLRDDNFHRILHDVRSTMTAAGVGDQPFGTALALFAEPFKQDLWERDVRIIPASTEEWASAHGDPIREQDAVRRLLVLLDYIGMRASSGASHLLDRHFDGVLSDAELEVGRALQALAAGFTPAEWHTTAGQRVLALLRELGWDGA
ncbi:SIR2 family protein [Luteitalea sp. TBR-22]|uniref:SIR2 family NAD-dependent protein deacylase n=1 Tax=Luteitalea sp. TBR-22 TaxID=2802971 RepID=UPI001AF6485D|nr:SIR2 family protein [Luteitalea sp. TBR-22]BCS32240.1 SIR2 family protein [Luteitalea sp. TBR-22]